MTVGNFGPRRKAAARVAQLLRTTRGSRRDGGEGSEGFEGSGAAKLNALVRSPVTPRRQADRLGTSGPNLLSRKRSSEV